MKKHISLLTLFLFLFYSAIGIAQPINVAMKGVSGGVVSLENNNGLLEIASGKAQLVSVPAKCKTVSIANPDICDIVMLGETNFILVGKKIGETNIYVWLEDDKKIMYTIKIFEDTEELQKLMSKILPYEKEIKVSTANNTIVLSGYVTKKTSIDQAQKIAEAFMAGKDTSKGIDVPVVNLLKVKDIQQVMLEVRFVEITRSNSDDRGIDWRWSGDFFGNRSDFALLEGGTPAYYDMATSPFMGIGDSNGTIMSTSSTNGAQGSSVGGIGWGKDNNQIAYSLDFIIAKGLGKIIAKPNLLVRNGEEASFLAGGEFPVPIQEDDSVRVEWKEFGVRLKFTPEIDERERINLTLEPEVSVLDYTDAAISFNGYDIPALKTRKTTTKVVLRDGESFFISGLISQSERKQMSKIPGIGNLPVLGPLFQKRENSTSETELVVFITPRLIKPIKNKVKKDFSDEKKMKLLTNSTDTPFDQAHADAIKEYIEQGEKPEKSLEQLREEEIIAELEKLMEENKKAEESIKKHTKTNHKNIRKQTPGKKEEKKKKPTAKEKKKAQKLLRKKERERRRAAKKREKEAKKALRKKLREEKRRAKLRKLSPIDIGKALKETSKEVITIENKEMSKKHKISDVEEISVATGNNITKGVPKPTYLDGIE